MEKEHWINGRDNGCEVKKEVWDGARFAEPAWFWNPDERWFLPARYIKHGCKNVFSAEGVIQAPNQLDGMKELYCDCCCTRFDHHPEYAYGDPRNIAYIGKIIFDKCDVHHLNEIGIFFKILYPSSTATKQGSCYMFVQHPFSSITQKKLLSNTFPLQCKCMWLSVTFSSILFLLCLMMLFASLCCSTLKWPITIVIIFSFNLNNLKVTGMAFSHLEENHALLVSS